jgi:putative endopeptidase
MKLTNLGLIALALAALAGCKNKSDDQQRTVFFDKSGMDTTVKPGDDFFMYANGKWIKNTKIPASEVSWGTFNTLRDTNEAHIHQILEYAAAHDDTANSINQKVGDLYKSGMDTAAIEKLGYDPVKPQLAKIAAAKDYKDLVKLAADGFKTGDGFLLGFYVSPDDKISTKNAAHFDQTGLNLPNRDYYFKTDTASKKILDGYVTYITRLFTLTGVDPATAAKKAADVLKLETAIAQASRSPVQLRDPKPITTSLALPIFRNRCPILTWGMPLNGWACKPTPYWLASPATTKR